MYKYLILVCLMVGNALQADDIAPPLPALYTVVDVGSDDVLNVRAMPDAAADITA